MKRAGWLLIAVAILDLVLGLIFYDQTEWGLALVLGTALSAFVVASIGALLLL